MKEFISILGFNENIALAFNEYNGQEYTNPEDSLEQELGWLNESGFCLESSALIDRDVQWGRYLRYLVQWAIGHSSAEYEGMCPACYDEWCSSEDEEVDSL